MKISKLYTLAVAIMGMMVASCSDSNDSVIDTSGYTDALVYGFKLPYNATYSTDSINNYHFTIDQYGEKDATIEIDGESLTVDLARIYNADSLPYGMVTKSLLAEITFSSPKAVNMYLAGGKTIKDYESTDSIDFTSPVIMEVIAGNGINKKFYELKVNVHKQVGDSIDWKYLGQPLAEAGSIAAQRAAVSGNRAVWFVQSAGEYYVYTSDKSLKQWEKNALNGFVPQIGTLKAFGDKFYAIAQDGKLFSSVEGTSWSVACDQYEFVNIIGSAQTAEGVYTLLGLVKDGGVLYHAKSSDGSQWVKEDAAESNFPVSGFSDIAGFCSTGYRYTSVIFGGKLQSGEITSDSWMYNTVDGWEYYSSTTVRAMQGANLVSYHQDPRYLNTFWLLIGGEYEENGKTEYSKGIYYSVNKGITWNKAEEGISLPSDFTARSFMSVYVDEEFNINLMGGNASDGVNEIRLNEIWNGRLNKILFKPIE